MRCLSRKPGADITFAADMFFPSGYLTGQLIC
jgi:hypothetical protein